MKLLIGLFGALVGLGIGLFAGADRFNPEQPAPRVVDTVVVSPSTTTPSAPPTTTVGSNTSAPLDPVQLIWGQDATAPSAAWSKPDIGAPLSDPVYGTPVRRVTSATGTRFDRNTYSRRQAENADGTRFMTYHGEAEYRVYDRATTELVAALPIHPDAEPQWHPSDPGLVRFISGPNSSTGELVLREFDLATGTETVIADLTDRLQAAAPGALYLKDRAEGSPSADGSRYAWMIYDAGEDPIGIVSYDLATDTVLGVAPIRTDVGDLDWVSMSPTGRYVVAGYWYGTFVLDADGLGNERQLNDKGDHSDIALDAAGRDAYVAIDFSSGPNAGWLTSIDLETLAVIQIFEVYGGANTSVHVSGKGYEKPGWVIVSTYNCKDPGAWSCEKVMAVEMAPGGRILNLAHTYNCGDDYWTETHAVVNRSFTRVYFNSDAGSCGIDAEVYELSVPAFD